MSGTSAGFPGRTPAKRPQETGETTLESPSERPACQPADRPPHRHDHGQLPPEHPHERHRKQQHLHPQRHRTFHHNLLHHLILIGRNPLGGFPRHPPRIKSPLVRPCDVARTMSRPEFGGRVAGGDVVCLPRIARPCPSAAEPAAPGGRSNLGGTSPVVPPVMLAAAVGVPAEFVLLLAAGAAGLLSRPAAVDAGAAHQNGRSKVELPGFEPGSAGCASALACVDTRSAPAA